MRLLAYGSFGLLLASAAVGCAAPAAGSFVEGESESEDALGGKRTVPSFEAMWSAYPRGTSAEAKATIGGAVDAEWIANTCAVRLSRSLNEAGVRIPDKRAGLSTVRGGDGLRYAYRVTELRAFLHATFGAPTLERSAKAGGVDPAPFAGRRGIIVFDVRGWSDATGHADLFDGASCGSNCYFEKAVRVELWEARSDEPPSEPEGDDAPAEEALTGPFGTR